MANIESAPLNPEPSAADERADQGLAPKSYAQATSKPYAEQQQENSADHDSKPNGGTAQHNDSKVNGSTEEAEKEPKDEDKVEFERQSTSDGVILTSIKPNGEYQKELKHDKETAPRENGSAEKSKKSSKSKKGDTSDQELSSGREAGAGWEKSAIRWAPLNVPLQRRLQTLTVLLHSTLIAMSLSFFFLLCAIPITWPLLIPYLIYTLIFGDEATSGTLSRRSERFRSSKWWSAFASYYPARLHRTVELEPTRKYIFGYHPHGIISHGAFAAFATEALGFGDLFPGITNTLLTLDSNFRIPLYRDYVLAMGLASVSKESIQNLLSKGGINGAGMGRAVTIVVGGARESLDAQPHSLRLVLNSRKGFVKLAIRAGADLVPVLSFGENDLYDQIDSEEHPWIHKWQMTVKKVMGFTVPLFHARGIFNYDVGLMPYRRPMNIVVGNPVKVVQKGAKDGVVDQEYIEQIHKEYVDELLRLWDTHKDTFAKERDGELEIVE